MALRSPRRIWEYLLADLARLVTLTCVCLVTVIAFAAAIKPLADGHIEPPQAIKVMGLAIVPMLQFALPFAAGFGATIVYHRFAADNEASAAMASGIAHRSLLVPALGVGLFLAIVLGVLSNQIIPKFLRSMEEVIARNAAQTIVSAIERGDGIHLGNFDIHATQVFRYGPSAEVGAIDHLVLAGVLAVQSEKNGEIERYISAERVTVWIFQGELDGEPATSIQLVFDGATAVQDSPDGSSREVFHDARVYSQRIVVPGAFSEDPKFLTFRELRSLKRNPQRIGKIESLRRDLALRLAERMMVEEAMSRVVADGSLVLEGPTADRVMIRTGGIELDDDRLRLLPEASSAMIDVRWVLEGGAERHQRAGAAYLELAEESGETSGQLLADTNTGHLVLTLERVRTVTSGELSDDADRSLLTFSGLTTPTDHRTQQLKKGVDALLADAQRASESSDFGRDRLLAAAERLKDRTADVLREAVSKLHERVALSASCLLMVLLGAVVGFKMKDSLPLPVYLWSFFPALICVLTIGAGQNLTHKAGLPGLVLLWGGVGALAVFLAREHARLIRH